MAIHTSFLGTTIISGDDARVFTRQLTTRKRVNKAAIEALENGRKMMAAFAKNGAVGITLSGVKRSATNVK